MGIFNIFDAKFCSFCGAQIPFMGNIKILDGNCCKQCASRLSPFFTKLKMSSVEQINHQLYYRNENYKKLQVFRTTKMMGENTKVLIDEEKMQFLVQLTSGYSNVQPDVIDFSSIMDCSIDIVESREEIKYKDSNGEVKSFNPKSYACSYDFFINIYVNIPYIEVICFKLNGKKVDNDAETLIEFEGGFLGKIADSLFSNRSNGNKTTNADEVRSSTEYLKYDQMATYIKSTMLYCRKLYADYIKVQRQKVVCPWCGVTVINTDTGLCPCCSGLLNA